MTNKDKDENLLRDLREAVGEDRAKELWEELSKDIENPSIWIAKATPEEIEAIKKTKFLGDFIVNKNGTCCLCYNTYNDYGHNARPIKEGRCCTDCDRKLVIPKRLEYKSKGIEWDNPIDPERIERMKDAYLEGKLDLTGTLKEAGYGDLPKPESLGVTIPKGSPWSEVEKAIGKLEPVRRVKTKDYMRKCQESLKHAQKHMPALWRAIMNKRYILPQWRQEDYVSQEACDYLMLDFIMEYTQQASNRGRDEVLNTQWIALLRALDYERPTLYLEREVAEKITKGKLPLDLEIDMIQWTFPSIRVYLPKGFLTIKRQGEECSLMYLDIVKAEQGVKYQLHQDFIEEILDEWGDYKVIAQTSHMTGMGVSGNLDFECAEGPLAYAGTTPLNQITIKQMLDRVGFKPLITTLKSDDLDTEFTNKMLTLALRVLMIMSSYEIIPDVLKPKEDDVIRKPRMEGQRLIAGLYKAKFVGDCVTQFRESIAKLKGLTLPTGIHTSPHWVCGHPKRQAYGPKRELRKLIWVESYNTKWHGESTNNGTV